VDMKVVEELLDELFSSLESLEAKSAATLQFLKQRDHVTDEQLAPYLEQAGNASNIRWRAGRLRIMSLLSAAMKSVEEPQKSGATSERTCEPATQASTRSTETESDGKVDEESAKAARRKDGEARTTNIETRGEKSDKRTGTESSISAGHIASTEEAPRDQTLETKKGPPPPENANPQNKAPSHLASKSKAEDAA